MQQASQSSDGKKGSPQSGDLDVTGYFGAGMIMPTQTRLLRIDDKEFTDLIKECAM